MKCNQQLQYKEVHITLQGILVRNHSTLNVALVHSCFPLPTRCTFQPSHNLAEAAFKLDTKHSPLLENLKQAALYAM